MSEFLAKLFIKDYKNVKDPDVRKKYGTMSSWVGIFTNVLLFSIKLFAGLISGSIAIMADAVNNLSDAGSSTVSLVSFKLASKPADRDHPFGHARIEYIASMIVSFLILNAGFNFLLDSGKKIFGFDTVSPVIELLPIILLSVSIILKFLLAMFYRSCAKKIDSGVIKAAATDSLIDSISTSAVLASSVIIKFTNFVLLDSIVGLCVSLLILFAGITILNETKNSIMGEAPTEELTNSIMEIISKYPDVIGVHDMIIHNYGPGHFIASFHAEVDGEKDIYALHDQIDNLEKEIDTSLGILCTIHLDPIETNNETVNMLKIFAEETVKEIEPNITLHDFRAVIGNTHTNIIFDIVLPFESKYSKEEITALICEKIQEKDSKIFCVITVDRG